MAKKGFDFPTLENFFEGGDVVVAEKEQEPAKETDADLEMRKLVDELNAASAAYYGGGAEILSDYEWDQKFDHLKELEQVTSIIYPDSPTQKVSSDTDSGVVSSMTAGERVAHEFPALSLDKSKDIERLRTWAENRPVWLSWKLDGLTLVLTYDGGRLSRVVTRGDGIYGDDITYKAAAIRGIPQMIPFEEHMVVRGEATISYTDFERVNAELPEGVEPYANPRNLASGTITLDDLAEIKSRGLAFTAFTPVYIPGGSNSWGIRMDFLDQMGFKTVERLSLSPCELEEGIAQFTVAVEHYDKPVDGLVLCYDNWAYSLTGSVTGHHATRAGIAYKWPDEPVESVLDHIEWSCASYAITPVAVFAPVQIEGTTVQRASLCNISECRRLGIGGVGTRVQVTKQNKIIPKVVAVTEAVGTFKIPGVCPVCGAPTHVNVSDSNTETLTCTNAGCVAKQVKKFAMFVSRKGMDIKGVSEKTIVRFINAGFIREVADFYHLPDHEGEIVRMDGFGRKSYDNLITAIEGSRSVKPEQLIKAMSIPMIGTDAARKIVDCIGFGGLLGRLENGTGFDDIPDIGPEKSNSFIRWYEDPTNKDAFWNVLNEVQVIEPVAADVAQTCTGLTFVITGAVHQYKNRDEFKESVINRGGAVAGSVTKKTDFLVTNDTDTGTAKNKKAAELGIPVITEDEFISRFGK